MNKSARLIFSVAPRVPTTRFLIKLHWLPIKARIEFKICLIVFKALRFGQPKYFKNTVNLFIHIARIPIGDSPRVHPNILKCPLHSPVAKGYRLVVIASRAMVCKTPTYYLILESLAYARGCVILRSHILILLLLILLIFHHIHS